MPSLSHVVALALCIAAAACGTDPVPEVTEAPAVTADGLAGPLCPVLPGGDQPGNPTFLRDLDHAEALTWIPVATVFEALGRAAGDVGWTIGDDVTLLVPSDDTLAEVFNDATLDALIHQRPADAAAWLDAHAIDGTHSLAGLVEAGTVTTRAGTSVTITGPADDPTMDDAGLLCGDYTTTSGRLHLIDATLGPLPPLEEDDGTHG